MDVGIVRSGWDGEPFVWYWHGHAADVYWNPTIGVNSCIKPQCFCPKISAQFKSAGK